MAFLAFHFNGFPGKKLFLRLFVRLILSPNPPDHGRASCPSLIRPGGPVDDVQKPSF